MIERFTFCVLLICFNARTAVRMFLLGNSLPDVINLISSSPLSFFLSSKTASSIAVSKMTFVFFLKHLGITVAEFGVLVKIALARIDGIRINGLSIERVLIV